MVLSCTTLEYLFILLKPHTLPSCVDDGLAARGTHYA
jgi:hypothetical protein